MRFDPHHGHRKSDDAGGTDRNFFLSQLEKARRFFGHVPGVLHSIRSCAGIGIAAVGDDRANFFRAEVDLGNPNGSGLDPVLGEHPDGEALAIRVDQAKIETVGLWVFNATGYCTAQKAACGADAAFDSRVGKIHRAQQNELALEVLQSVSFQISYH